MSDTEKPEGENETPAEESKAEEKSAAEKVLEEKSAAEKVIDGDGDKADEPKADEPKADEKAEEPKADEKAEEPKADEKAEEPKAEEPKADEKAEEPKADEKAEEPKAEEPKAEEPKAEEPKADEKAEEPKAEEPKAEEPKAEEPKAEEPKAEEPKAEEPVGEPVAAAVAKEEILPTHLGMLIEFETEDALMHGCEQVRDAGYSNWDAHTPYPVHGVDAAMGVRPTILPWMIVAGGITGAMTGMILQLYTNGIELPVSLANIALLDPFLPSGYQFVTSGKPIFSVPANIPVTFELTILFSALTAFLGMWGLNKLPRWYHPVFNSERFKRATQDRFFISILKDDPLYDRKRTRALADRLGGSFVEELAGEEV